MKEVNEKLEAVNEIQDNFYFQNWENETTCEHKMQTLNDLKYLQNIINEAIEAVEEEIFKRLKVGL